MFQKILVPVNRTPLSDHLVTALSWLLTPLTGSVVLAYVASPNVQEKHRQDALRMLEEYGSRFRAYGIRAEYYVAKGDVPTTLAEQAVRHHVDLIAITLNVLSQRHTLESVSNHLLHTVTVPVLLIPQTAPPASLAPHRHIVVPLDGTLGAEHALHLAVTLARDTQARLLLVRGVERQGRHEPDDALADMHGVQALVTRHTHSATLYLQRVAARITQEGISCHLRVLVSPPADAIVKAATAEHADLIVMSMHGHGVVERWFHGSVTEHVVRDAPCPVLVLPATRDWLRHNVALDPYQVIPPRDLTFAPFIG